jgi:hypothetical protein
MSSKKTTTDTSGTQSQQSTSTPNVPDWISQPAQAMAGNINSLIAQGPGGYTPQMSALQKQAVTGAAGLTTPDAYGQASDTLNGVPNVQGQSVLDNLSAYYNPFQSQVLNPAMADYDYQAGQTRAAQAAQAAQGGAFGGSRYGVQAAQTEGDLARGRAATEGGLLNQMYTQATGLSAGDAANRQAAMLANQNAALQKGGLLTNLGTAEATTAGKNVELQNAVGGEATAQENAARQYPLQYQQQVEGLLQGLNPQMYTGQSTQGSGTESSHATTVQDPGLLASIGQGLGIASTLFGNPAGGLAGMVGGGGGAGAVGGALPF